MLNYKENYTPKEIYDGITDWVDAMFTSGILKKEEWDSPEDIVMSIMDHVNGFNKE